MAACLIFLLGCPRGDEIWFEGDLGQGRPAFGLSKWVGGTKPIKVHTFWVQECWLPDSVDSGVVWRFRRSPKTGNTGPSPFGSPSMAVVGAQSNSSTGKLRRVVYGEVPHGYEGIVSASPLKPQTCYVARASQSSEDDRLGVFFRTLANGTAVETNGFVLDSLWPSRSKPVQVPATTAQQLVPARSDDVMSAIERVLEAHGLRIDNSTRTMRSIRTLPTAVSFEWGGEPIDRRVDCGVDPDGWSRVLLPISVAPDTGYGRLRVRVRVNLEPVGSGTSVKMASEAVLDAPYFERGDRQSIECTLTTDFVAQLQREIAKGAIGGDT